MNLLPLCLAHVIAISGYWGSELNSTLNCFFGAHRQSLGVRCFTFLAFRQGSLFLRTTNKTKQKQPRNYIIMARQKRTSPIAEAAGVRADSLESIDPALDLGNGLSVGSYRSAIAAVLVKLSAYNTKLSELDGVLNGLEAGEKELADLSERMLTGVATKYGKNSDQYEKAGGTKKSEIKRGPKKKKPPTA